MHSSSDEDDEQPASELPQLEYLNGGDRLLAVKNCVGEDVRVSQLETLSEPLPEENEGELPHVMMLCSFDLF